ncbi:FERM domain-containing protein C [Diplonema papillatum]|nr:FERM domain-containing protein C [Diplonema papillatum]
MTAAHQLLPGVKPATWPSSKYVREPACPAWMSHEDFEAAKHDPERLLELCHLKVQASQRTLDTTRKLTESLHNDPQYQYAQAVQSFEELRKEHLQLNDSYNDLETINETVQEVVEVLRTDKHQLLAELNALKREISIQSIENTKLALKEKEAVAFQEGLSKKLTSQEQQLAQLDDELRDYSNSQIQINNEIGALESAAHNLSLQTASLSELRNHLDSTRLQQEEAIRALEAEIEQKVDEVIGHDEQLWDFKRDMSARILALQRKVQAANDELSRLHRLSEHEMNTLSQQNRALNDELKSKTDQLFATRKEMNEFSNSARREINIKREEIQQCMSIVDLVERQNAGLEASIARMLEQNRVSENQIQEKDNINNKNLIEQANFIAMVHMELQTVREDLYMIKSRLCHHCRDRLLAGEQLDDEQEELLRIEQGPAAYAQSLGLAPAAATPGGHGPGVTQPPAIMPGSPRVGTAAELAEKDRVQDELRRAHDALEALNRQLLEEREERARERREEEDSRKQEEDDKLLRMQDEDLRRRRTADDDKRKQSGEDLKTFTIRFVNGTRKKVDAFLSDTVQDLINRVSSKIGVRPFEMFHLAHAVNENSVLGTVDRFLDKTKTLYEEGINTKCNLVFKFKHYKRLHRWSDVNTQDRFFQQLQRNVVTEYYPTPEKLAVALAGYELQVVFGDATGKKRHSYFDKVGLDAYLPVSVTPLGYEYWQERLYRNHKRKKGLSPTESRNKYIDKMRQSSSHWGMTFFDIRDKENRPFVAGIGEDGLHILSADKRVLIQSLRFMSGPNQLAGWEKSSTGIFVKKRDSKLMTLYASSKLQSEEMYNLLNEYYCMLPRDMQQGLGIEIPEREHVCQDLLPPETFLPPVEYRTLPVEFGSAAEYLKAIYLEQIFSPDDSDNRPGPVLKFINCIDEALDENLPVQSMDLSFAEMADSDWSMIAELIVRALDYDPAAEPSVAPAERLRSWQDNLQLEKLSVEGNDLSEASVPATKDVLNRCVALTDVNLSGLPLDNRHEAALVEPLMRLKLQKLAMCDCLIGDKGVRAILELFNNRTLTTLLLNGNRITANVMADLAGCLDLPYCVIDNIGLGTNKIQLRGLETLIQVMERARRPSILDFSDNPLQARGGQRFGQLVEQQCGLVDLDISNATGQMNITGDVGLYITRQLLNNPEMLRINFSDNSIGQNLHPLTDPSGQVTRDLPLEFFTFLEREAICNLTTLELNRCELNHDHGAALTSALLDNHKLKKLYLSGNKLSLADGSTPQGWVDLLEITGSLEELDMSLNGFQSRGLAVLFTALAKNRSLRKLTLDGNRVAGDDSSPLDEAAYMMSTNSTLVELRMAEMGIDDHLLERMAEGLSENSVMKKLIAPRNVITTRGILDSAKYFAVNTSLEELDLTCASVQQVEDEYMRAYKFLIDNTNLETILM